MLINCFVLDSDVMIYTDITEHAKYYEYADFTLEALKSGHTLYLNNIRALTDFNSFVSNVYNNKDNYYYSKLLAHYHAVKKYGINGGVGDMVLLQLFHKEYRGLIGDTTQIVNNSIFDQNINISDPGFEMEKGIKKIRWKDGLPYGRLLKTGEDIKFNSLHFQSREMKKLMGEYLTENNTEINLERKSTGKVNK